MLKKKAEVGIAYDGDADRIGVVDDQGNVLWGDQLMILFSRALLEEEPGRGDRRRGEVLVHALRRHPRKRGGRAIMWKAGHCLIKAKMKEEKAQLAGEMSGHIFFKHRYYGFDDAVYSSARLLELLTHDERPLSALLGDVPQTFSSPELRVDSPEEKKFEIVRRAKEFFAGAHERSTVDGVRVVFPDGWGLVRASNTQPLLVLRFEATHAGPARGDPAARRGQLGRAPARGRRLVRRTARHPARSSVRHPLGVDLGGTNARAAVVEADSGGSSPRTGAAARRAHARVVEVVHHAQARRRRGAGDGPVEAPRSGSASPASASGTPAWC